MGFSIRRLYLAVVVLNLWAAPGALQAQGNHLGTVRFPNSGAPAAQRPFIRGVLLLHSFEYPAAAAAFREAQKADPGFALAYWGEAMTWTHPVWNQQNVDSARAVLQRLGATQEARRAKAGNPPRASRSLLSMRAQYLANSGRWDDSMTTWPLSREDVDSAALGVAAFGLGYAAFQRGDRATADSLQHELTALAKAATTGDRYDGTPGILLILDKELRALLRARDSAPDEALALLREAAALEDALPVDFGPPEVVKPSHELLGEVLLGLRRPADAQREFVRALVLAPRRSLSLLGLARSAQAAGDQAIAAQAYSELRRVWHVAEPGLPGMAEVTGASGSAH